jgi:outer membrane autotransporter protein
MFSRTLNSAVDGSGPMAGPYISVKLSENLFFDARTVWGVSDNKVNPFGVYEDKFTTNRWLARASLTGNWRFGDFRVTPSAGVVYVEEKQNSYTDRLGVFIPGQTVSLGRLDVGPEVGYRIMVGEGAMLEPQVSLKGVWDFHRPETNAGGPQVISSDEFRARLQAGLIGRSANGWSVRASVNYDGIGSKNFRDLGGQLWVSVPLH